MATKQPVIKKALQKKLARSYPVALAYLESQGVVPPNLQPGGKPGPTEKDCLPKPLAKVRPGIVSARAATGVPQDLLEKVVDVAQIGGVGGEQPSFYLSFRQDALGPVRCEISLVKGQVVATFDAEDGHTSRLLSAESSVLRNLLLSRGLGAAEVIVRGPKP